MIPNSEPLCSIAFWIEWLFGHNRKESKKEMGEVRHKLQEIIENPDIFLFKEALFVYPTAAQIHATNSQKFPKTNLWISNLFKFTPIVYSFTMNIPTKAAAVKEQNQNKRGGFSLAMITAAADRHNGSIESITAVYALETSAKAKATAPGNPKTMRSPMTNSL